MLRQLCVTPVAIVDSVVLAHPKYSVEDGISCIVYITLYVCHLTAHPCRK
jgi:hypothetical protein